MVVIPESDEVQIILLEKKVAELLKRIENLERQMMEWRHEILR